MRYVGILFRNKNGRNRRDGLFCATEGGAERVVPPVQAGGNSRQDQRSGLAMPLYAVELKLAEMALAQAWT
jgi:hypothetical protein